mgnify:CR=1 FL=1
MKRESYEIWRHEESQTWKVFTNLTQELRQTLASTGWSPVVQHKEEDCDGLEMCPEELLRRLSRGGGKS